MLSHPTCGGTVVYSVISDESCTDLVQGVIAVSGGRRAAAAAAAAGLGAMVGTAFKAGFLGVAIATV